MSLKIGDKVFVRYETSEGRPDTGYEGIVSGTRDGGDIEVEYVPENARAGRIYRTWWPESCVSRKPFPPKR